MRHTSSEQEILRRSLNSVPAWGRLQWSPPQARLELIIGVSLTQNTSRLKMEIATRQLQSARVLTVEGIRETPLRNLRFAPRVGGCNL